MSILEKHKDKWVVDSSTGCYYWIGGCHSHGYGRVSVAGKSLYVHRLVLEEKLGRPIHRGMHAEHLCGNGHLGCVNPDHLSEASPRENSLRRSRESRVAGVYAALETIQERARGYSRVAATGRYIAQAMIRRVRYNLGTYDTPQEAHDAYVEFMREHVDYNYQRRLPK